MSIKYFITGTDTEVGKTYISVGILKAFNRLKMTTLGLKPVASGIQHPAFYPHDSIQLQRTASIKLPLNKITPFAFQEAIAPHIAAQKLNKILSVNTINQACQETLDQPADVCVIEGFGGWCAPLNNVETMADFVSYNQYTVILVVGMRLGCLNHAILTQKIIQQSDIKIAGWIANCMIPEMAYFQENLMTLKKYMKSPYLGTVSHHALVEDCIDIKKLIF